MKKPVILFLFLAGASFISCRKAYTCDCVLTDRYDDGDTTFTVTAQNTSSTYSKKMTKKQATAACDHEEASLVSGARAFDDAVTLKLKSFGVTRISYENYSAECKLK